MRTPLVVVIVLALLSGAAHAQPTADFTASPASGVVDLTVTFTDQSSGGGGFLYQWDFGDGQQALLIAAGAQHTYTQPGTYTVSLTISGAAGSDSETKTGLITVTPATLVPAMTATPTSGVLPLGVQFTDVTTGTGTPSQRTWDFGDGTTSTELHPAHLYDAPGTYTVSLSIVSGGQTFQAVETDLIQVDPTPLVADFTASPTSGMIPLDVTFTDTSSGAAVESWTWDFGDGSTSTEQHPAHTYLAPGSYTVSLTTTVGQQVESVTKTDLISADPTPLVADFRAAPTSGMVPLDVALTDTSTGAAVETWLWDFGDGSTSTEQHPSHVYFAAGTYTVSLTTSVAQQVESVTKTDLVAVAPAPPLVADFVAAPTSGTVPLAVFFLDQSTGPPPQSWAWDFGDGNTSTAPDTGHLYHVPGTYTVSLTVSFLDDVDIMVQQDVIVAAAPVVRVPADYATIQAALDAAPVHAEIRVAPGIYHEAIVLNGQVTTLRSTGGAGSTVIDATGLGQPVVQLVSGEPIGTVIDGFTLTGGSGVHGGGVLVGPGASVDLRRCIIRGNTASADGGGVYCDPGVDAVRLEDCVLADNLAGGRGGGVQGNRKTMAGFFLPPVTLEGCALVGNAALHGGGAYEVLADRCLFEANGASSWGGGANSSNLVACILRANRAERGGGVYNGGFFEPLGFAPYDVDACVFVGNAASVEGGGALFQGSAEAGPAAFGVSRCVFSGNDAPLGDGVSADLDLFVSDHCTFIDDGIAGSINTDIDVRNSIVRGATAALQTSGTITVEASNIEDGWPGPGNIDADPLFVGEGLRCFGLLPGSPCIDAATGLPDPDGSAPDMGARTFATDYDVAAPLYGGRGLPALDVTGAIAPGAMFGLGFERGPPGGSVTLVLGATPLGVPFKGGVFVPDVHFLVPGLPLGADGDLSFVLTWPTGLPSGSLAWLQGWFGDPAGPVGFSSTQGVVLVQP